MGLQKLNLAIRVLQLIGNKWLMGVDGFHWTPLRPPAGSNPTLSASSSFR